MLRRQYLSLRTVFCEQVCVRVWRRKMHARVVKASEPIAASQARIRSNRLHPFSTSPHPRPIQFLLRMVDTAGAKSRRHVQL